MKANLCSLLTSLAAGLIPSALAQWPTFNWSVGQPIPDGSAVGLADSQVVNVTGTAIALLRVNLEITGRGGAAFNGDLYATLVHNTGFTVLLNRPGRRTGDLLGYGDNGLNVTFDDSSGSRDIHSYRFELSGGHDVPLGAPLAGVWATDARPVDPDSVLDTDNPTAGLSWFDAVDPNGTWTLYVADLEPGNLATLEGWGLEIAIVPEPADGGLLLGVGGLAWALNWRRGRR